MQAAGERKLLLEHAHLAGYPNPADEMHQTIDHHPVLFGCLPLEQVVGAYTLAMLLACLWWLVNLFESGYSSGGWAFLTAPLEVNFTFWLEVCVYSITVAFSIFAVLAMIMNTNAHHYEEEEALKIQKRCTIVILVYFIASIMRFAFFIPITGMVVAAKNVCNFYMKMAANIALDRPKYSIGAPLHCTQEDWLILAGTIGTLLLDAYLVWGVLRLWQTYRAECRHLGRGSNFGPSFAFSSDKSFDFASEAQPGYYYGTADPFMPSQKPVWVQ